MKGKVILKGPAITCRHARQIIAAARRSSQEKQCPYKHGCVKWSVWITAFRYRTHQSIAVFTALVKAGAQCNFNETELKERNK